MLWRVYVSEVCVVCERAWVYLHGVRGVWVFWMMVIKREGGAGLCVCIRECVGVSECGGSVRA